MGSSYMNESVIDAKIDATEARTDVKIERLLSEMRTGFSSMRLWFVLTSLALMVTAATLAAAVFNIGRFVALFGVGS
jgi:hypothetical protein